MKEVLAFIEKKKQEFAQIEFIQFLQNSNIPPAQRLAFAPSFAPFVMGFGELNSSVWRVEGSSDPIQVMINKHTYEDDAHWVWFLEDIQKLGFDTSFNFSDALRFIWSEETQASRKIIYELYRYTCNSTPMEKLVVIEAAEAMADIFLTSTKQVTQELKAITQTDYRYFGIHHFSIDTNHSMHSSAHDEFIKNIPLTPEKKDAYINLANKIFILFTDFLDVLTNAKLYNFEKLSTQALLESSTFNESPKVATSSSETLISK